MINLATIKTSVLTTVNAGKRFIIKHSPEILVGAGVIGVVTGTVMACSATVEAADIVDDLQCELDEISEKNYNDSSKDLYKRDVTSAYFSHGLKIVKAYAPAVTTEILGVSAILCGYGIIKKRNVALVGAYKSLESIFGDYRSRVVEELGEKADFKFLHGYAEDDIEEEPSGVKTITGFVPPTNISGYARIFDEYNDNWSKDPQQNRFFLAKMQAYFNNLLQVQGHVFLNEVYDALGFPRTSAGAIVGWVVDGPDSDNVIDFGIYNITANDDTSDSRVEFINARTPSVLLDFNVDGVIYDLI